MRDQPNATPRPNLLDLTPENIKLEDLPRFPSMTGWFEPVLLGKLLLRVIISDVFGQYADRRLIQAALDTVDHDEFARRADLTNEMRPDADGAIWLDYVADLGDGFDPTYAIAYFIAQPTLTIDGQTLPRGNLLVMGGDEVYPTAARDDYNARLRKPYSLALPDKKGSSHPLALLLPGNHDWYDGLVNFLAIFCREKQTAIGDWRTRQRRSYFTAKLTENWWLWCIDIALVRDMDQPQADYFVAIAQHMQQGANIILCSAEPGWYKAEENGDSYRTLSYATSLAKNAKKDLNIALVLSGDTHHYARYSDGRTEYITSGGGGAFLHGTLELKPEIKAKWLVKPNASLTREACYPSQSESAQLLNGNWSFFNRNRNFSFLLGGMYALGAFALTSLPRWDVALLFYLVLAGGLVAYTGYQERFDLRITLLSGAHALVHFAAAASLSYLSYRIGDLIRPFDEWHWLLWLLLLIFLVIPLGAPIAGTIFGVNLLITCRHFGINHNDAFSSMQLQSHRHFLRIRIRGDTLTVHPIALDAVPKRHQWRENPKRAADPTASIFVPPDHIVPRSIETPIVINARQATTTAEVRPANDIPKQ